MQSEKFAELEERASQPAERDEIAQLQTRSRVEREIEKMITEQKAMELSSEEEDMLRSFRRFKLRMTAAVEVFSWQTRRPAGVQIAEDTAQIVHPAEVYRGGG